MSNTPVPDTPDSSSEPPEPPLHRASRLGDIAEMERLVHAGADVNARADYAAVYDADLWELTPLMVAAQSIDGASVATLEWLFAHGADREARSKTGRSATWYAAGKGGRSAYHAWRIAPDHVDRLRCLLDAGHGEQESAAVTAAHLREACAAGDPARVRLLLARGRNPDGERRAQGLSSRQMPLFCAAESGSVECVRALLEAGADPNQIASDGKTPLFAVPSAAVARLLVDAGARVDVKDNVDEDVLSALLEKGTFGEACASAGGDPVPVLIAAGLDPFVLEAGLQTRLAREAFRRNADAVAYLLGLGAPVTPPAGEPTALERICWQSDVADDPDPSIARIIDLLVNAGISPDRPKDDEDGYRTPLLIAVDGDGDNATAVQALLKHGAIPDAPDRHGQTPLIYASNDGALASVRALLEAGADPTRKDQRGRSCLDLARARLEYWERTRRGEAPQTSESTREFHANSLRQAEETVRLLEESLAKRP